MEAVAKSIREFGFRQPIVVDEKGVVIVGHTRLKAARKLGLATVPVHVAKMTHAQAKAYRIADNQTATIADWDKELLPIEVLELKAMNFDLELLGFDKLQLDDLLRVDNEGLCDPDEVPEVPADPITKPGDLWVLGEHRLLCGDSTKAEDLTRLMAGSKATCIFTDPPYGVSIGAKNRLLNSVQPSGRCLDNIADDDLTPEALEESLLGAFVNIRTVVMADDCSLFVCSPQGCGLSMMMMMMMMMMQKAGLKSRHVLIWIKNQPTFSMNRLDYDYQHEPILFTWLKRHKRPMRGEHRTSVWRIDKPRASPDHPTMKPVALYANAYLNNSDSGDVVFDAYCGSGTAIVAAEQLSRRCYAIEISPQYCDVAVKRWEKFTGKTAHKA